MVGGSAYRRFPRSPVQLEQGIHTFGSIQQFAWINQLLVQMTA